MFTQRERNKPSGPDLGYGCCVPETVYPQSTRLFVNPKMSGKNCRGTKTRGNFCVYFLVYLDFCP